MRYNSNQKFNNQYYRSDNMGNSDENSNKPAADMSYVKFLHASPNAPAVDVYVDDKKVVVNLAFSKTSEYLPMSAGTHNVKVYATGTIKNPVIDKDIEVSEKTRLTLAIIGNSPNIKLLPIPEDILSSMSNETRIRVAHLSPNAPAVDVTLSDGDVTFENVQYSEVTDYTKVPSGIYTLQIKPTGSNTAVLTISNVEFMPNFFYTIYVLGQVNIEPPLQVYATVNRTPGVLTSEFNEEYYPLKYEISTNKPQSRQKKSVNSTLQDFKNANNTLYGELDKFGLNNKISDFLVRTIFEYVTNNYNKYRGNTKRKANIATRDLSLLYPWIFELMASLDIPPKKAVDTITTIVSHGFDNLGSSPSSRQ